jgi:hypothetical protein
VRPVLIALALLAVGFGVGLYASKQGDDSSSPPPARPAAAVRAPTATVAQPPPPATTAAPTTATTPPPAAKPRPHFTVAPLPRSFQRQMRKHGFWHPGCPVSLSGLRLLEVTYRGFDGQVHSGQLVVNSTAAAPLKRVFRRLYGMRFPIRHIGFAAFYGPKSAHPSDGDVTGSFECRQSVPSPCTGGLKSGHWSMHAYGLAVDLNPTENPYIGCGMSRDPATKPYRDRSKHRRGMIGPRVVSAFGSVGWGWGGAWTGSTKDFMHFSSTGH